MSEPQTIPSVERTISGRWLVIGMFAMGITATSLLYVYSSLHLGPFRPLQDAIVAEFPGSAPRVDGGRKRLNEDSPTILRILMKTEIDPDSDSEDSLRKMNTLRKRIAELVLNKTPLPDIGIIELRVYKLLQEDKTLARSFRLNLRSGEDWVDVDPGTKPVAAKTN